MKLRLNRSLLMVALIALLGLGVSNPSNASGFSVNGSAAPTTSDVIWQASDAGWTVTPNTSFSLTNVETDFNGFGINGDSVTAVLYKNGPPSSGGTLVDTSSAVAVPGSGGPITFNFSTPAPIISGDSYMVGLQNISGLGVNLTSAAGATTVPYFYDIGGATYVYSYNGPLGDQPILNLSGSPLTAVTPESNGALLMLAGLLPIGLVALLTRRKVSGRRR